MSDAASAPLDPSREERRSHLKFLLSELETWQKEISPHTLDALRIKYRQQLVRVEVEMGLRPPPLGSQAARAVVVKAGQRQALLNALTYWTRIGLLSDEQLAQLQQELIQEITQLKDELVDAQPFQQLDAEHLVLEKWRYLRAALEQLYNEGRLAPNLKAGIYQEALQELEQGIQKREQALGIQPAKPAGRTPLWKKALKPERPVVQKAPPADAVQAETPQAATPAQQTPLPAPRPARQPLTWDRVMSTLLSERTLQAILFMGCLLLFAAAVSLVVWNWETFSPELQLVFLVLFTLTFYGLGWLVRVRMKLRGSGLALTGVGSLLVPLDFYAIYLSGGFPPQFHEEIWLLASALCMVIYLATTYWLQSSFFGYLVGVAAGSLVAASMNIMGITQAWWQSGLAATGLGLAAAALRLSKSPGRQTPAQPEPASAQAKNEVSPEASQPAIRQPVVRTWRVFEQPLWWVALFGMGALLALSTGYLLTSSPPASGYTAALALSWWLGGATVSLALVRFKHGALASAAALSFPAAVLVTQRAWFEAYPAHAAWYALGPALLAAVYLLLARPEADHAPWLRIRQFRSIFVRTAVILAGLAALGALLDVEVMGVVHPWLALVAGVATWLWRRPWLSLLSSLLLLTTAAAWLAWSGAALSQLGVAWALLSILQVVAAVRLKEARASDGGGFFAAPVFTAAWVTSGLALLPPLFLLEQPALAYSLGHWMLLNGWLAWLVHTGNTALGSVFPPPGAQPAVRLRVRLSAVHFHWGAAAASLPWLWLTWGQGYANINPDHRLAFLFVAAAFPLLLLGRRLAREHPAYEPAWFSAAQVSAAGGLALTIDFYDAFLFTFTWLAAAVFWMASAQRRQQPFWLYLGGTVYTIGWMNGLIWAKIDLNGYSLALAWAALLFVLGGGWLSRRPGNSPALTAPLYTLGLLAGAVSFCMGFVQIVSYNASDLSLAWTAAGWGLLAVSFGLQAWFTPSPGSPYAHAAAWLGVAAGGLVAFAYSQGQGSSALKAALVAAAYLLAERGLLWLSFSNSLSTSKQSFIQKAYSLYGKPLLFAGWPVTGGSVLLALVANLWVRGGGPVREAWSAAGLLVVTGLYAAGAHWYRQQPRSANRFAWLAFLLLPFPWTLLYRLVGHYTKLWPVPDVPWHAVAWAALAFLYGLFAVWLLASPRRDLKWARPARGIAYLLMLLALAWGSGRAEVSVVTYGLGLALFSLLAWNDWTRDRKTLFMYPAVWLAPAWAVYLTIRIAPDAPQTVFGVLLLGMALPFLLGGVRWLRRKQPDFTRLAYPFFSGGWILLLVGTALVAHDITALAWSLVYISVLSAGIAWLLEEPLWLYITTAALPAALLLAFSRWEVPGPRHGWGLTAAAAVYIFVSWTLKRFVKTGKDWSAPWLAAAFALIAFGLVPSSRERFTAAVDYGAAAVLYALLAAWLKQPLLLWPAVGLVAVPYWVLLLELERPVGEYGLLMWPFIGAVLLLAHVIDRRQAHRKQPGSWGPVAHWPRMFFEELNTRWSLPFFSAAYLGAAVSLLPSLNAYGAFPFTPLLAAAAYGLAVAYFRKPAWLLLAAGAGQLAVLEILIWSGQRLTPLPEPGWYALAFTPVTVLTFTAGLLLQRRERRAPGPGGWSGKLFLLGVVDLLVVQTIALPVTPQARWITLIHGLLLLALAAAWRWQWMSYPAAALGLLALVQHLLWIELPSSQWAWTIALLALAFGLVAYGLLPYGRPQRPPSLEKQLALAWSLPLRQSAWLLSSAAMMLALAFALDVPGILIRILLDQPLLTPTNIPVVQSLVATLSISGLFYLAAAATERMRRLGYAAVGLMLVAWSLEWLLVWDLREVQWYAVPAGLYLLGVGYLEWKHGGAEERAQAVWIDRAAILLLLGSSFWQSLTTADGWPYALLMGLEGILLAWWGSARRLRRFLYAGVMGVTIDAVGQSIEPLLSDTNRWIVLLVAGLFLVIVGILVERRLEQVKRLSGELSKRLEDWQ